MVKTSKFLSLDIRDIAKGFLVAFVAFALNWAQEVFIPNLNVSDEIKTLILAGLAYLAKNLFTGAKEVRNFSEIGLPKPGGPKP